MVQFHTPIDIYVKLEVSQLIACIKEFRQPGYACIVAQDVDPALFRYYGVCGRLAVLKLCQCAQKKWYRLHSSRKLAEVIRGVVFVNGIG